MSLTRYEPWSVFGQLQGEINRLFDARGDAADSSATADWAPSVDIHEFSDRFLLRADLPGVNPDSVEITLDNGVLTVAGVREREVEEAAERHRIERIAGRFYRRFTLPDTVEPEKVAARSVHGVLEVTIPKREAAQPLKIKVAA